MLNNHNTIISSNMKEEKTTKNKQVIHGDVYRLQLCKLTRSWKVTECIKFENSIQEKVAGYPWSCKFGLFNNLQQISTLAGKITAGCWLYRASPNTRNIPISYEKTISKKKKRKKRAKTKQSTSTCNIDCTQRV